MDTNNLTAENAEGAKGIILPQYLDPTAGTEHQHRFAAALQLFNRQPAEYLLLANCPALVMRIQEALQVCAAIEWLRDVEGDEVAIYCDNPEPNGSDDQRAVVCNGGWTDYEDKMFYAETVAEALDKACRAREAGQKGGH